MGYSPPSGNAVTFNFTSFYSPPYGLTVTFNFGSVSPPGSNANVFRALQTAVDEEAGWRDPRARQFYASPTAPPAAAIYPFARQNGTIAAMLADGASDWTDPRSRMRYGFQAAVVASAVRPVLFTVM